MSGPTDTTDAIRIDHVGYRFGGNKAVDDISLTVGRGECFGLLGPNGAGKTTMIRLINTLLPLQDGQISIFGLSVRDEQMGVRRQLGYVPQQLSVEGALTARENVGWFARLYDVPRGQRKERVASVLEMLDLTEFADRLASTFSGGMVRRLELAQALVNRPALLVLDEPTVGLDPVARDSVWERVRDMRSQFGMTVLLTTHYMEEADVLCDRVAMMHLGKLRAVGTPAALKAALGPGATLEDVFRHHTGDTLVDGKGGLGDVRTSRRTAGSGIEPALRLLSRVNTFCLVELQKLRHDRTELLTRAIQPILWLVVFGETFSRIHAIPTGNVPYLDYLAPGIIAQSALFVAIFYGIQIIWERDAGVLTKLLVTPTPRAALVTGKAFAAGVRAVAQAVVVIVVAALLGVGMTWNPLRLLGVVAVVVLGAAFFACLSVTIAGIVLKRDRLMGIGQAITMPLFFASNALYPVALMPAWVRAISTVNPLSYEVSALRGLLIGQPTDYWLDFGVLIGSAAVGIVAASVLLGRLAR